MAGTNEEKKLKQQPAFAHRLCVVSKFSFWKFIVSLSIDWWLVQRAGSLERSISQFVVFRYHYSDLCWVFDQWQSDTIQCVVERWFNGRNYFLVERHSRGESHNSKVDTVIRSIVNNVCNVIGKQAMQKKFKKFKIFSASSFNSWNVFTTINWTIVGCCYVCLVPFFGRFSLCRCVQILSWRVRFMKQP